MGASLKPLVLLIVLVLISSSALMVASASAQSTSKPSVPQFTLQVQDGIWLNVTVQNQPIIPNGYSTANIFYEYRIKWHESADWFGPAENETEGQFLHQTSSVDTTNWFQPTDVFYTLLNNSDSRQLDFQLRAINGYTDYVPISAPPVINEPNTYVVIVNTSDWSSTQTVMLPEQPLVYPVYLIPIAVLIVVIVIGVGFFVYDFRKHKSI